ncbi:6910_t:CDS:2 [Ambispora leptoticha]|uniref:6910_t:CDS:1 n=1 Tax=Ambispora leptoticha TaxID=144679 RepID=A0A9N9HKN3_9GLOM|nr:6910_t:CDS:2 [Ambispora leptoticha]
MFTFIPIETNHDNLIFRIPFNNSENYHRYPTTSIYCHPHAYFNHAPTRRHETYYDANNLENIVSELKHLERKRAEEKALYEKRQRIYAEREREIRQRAYRQWVLNQQAKQEALRHIFELRAAAATLNKNQDIYNHSCSNLCRKSQSSKQRISKQEAAKRIIFFMRHRLEKRSTLLIINKLKHLRFIEQHLVSLFPKSGFNPNLTFTTENAKQILPITANNRAYLIKEESILKTLDALDRVESNGIEIIRERRKQVVRIAQKMLEVLDNIKDKQWKEFSKHEQEECGKVETDNMEKENKQEKFGKNVSGLEENDNLIKSTPSFSENTDTTSNINDNIDNRIAIKNEDSVETTIPENKNIIPAESVAAKVINEINENSIELEKDDEFIVL